MSEIKSRPYFSFNMSKSPAAMVVYLNLEYIVFFFAEYCCPDPLFEDSGGCGGVTLGQF